MSRFKCVITFGIGLLMSVILGFVVSKMLLSGITDSLLHIILNTAVIVIFIALINIPVFLFIINNKN